ANAGIDDGSCDYTACYGCTDPTALNYDATMTMDDGSCFYCQLTATTSVVDETGACDGSVDLTVSGTWCQSTVDLFVSVAGGNGQNGNVFNLINTSGADLYIDGFSQGPGSGNSTVIGAAMEVMCSYSDYTVGTPTWTSVATDVVDLNSGLTTGYIQIPGGVTIPAGGTYGFFVGRTDGATVQYTNGTGTAGVSTWASDANLIVTEGHGSIYSPGNPGLNFSPRNWNGTVHYGDPNAVNMTYSWSNGAVTEDLANVCAGAYTVTATDCYGCTVSATANVVLAITYGCTDPAAFNYDPTANTDDGSCIAVAMGCTDTAAANYDASANTDDGSCHYCFGGYNVTIDCGGGSWASEVSWELVDAAGTIVLSGGAPFNDPNACLDGGCYTVNMYDAFGDGWNGNALTITENVSGASASVSLAAGSAGFGTISLAELGCFLYGCMDPLATNYDVNANTDDGSCTYPGCVTSLPFAEDFETGTADVTLMSGAMAQSTIGNTNNVTATNTYTWHGQGGPSPWPFTPSDGATAFGFTDYVATMAMCVDLTAYAGQPVTVSFDLRQEYSFNPNYSWFRLTDDAGTLLVDGNGTDYFQPATNCADAWETVSFDLSAYAGSSVTLMFQSSCKYYDDYYQCGDNAYVDNINISISAAPVLGCTDPAAVNYDASANTDDGSCCYSDLVTLNLYDSFGDGWNGNSVTINGVDYTMGTGSSISFVVCADLLICTDVTYNATGSWQSENSWDVTDASGTVIGSGGANSGTFGTCAAPCLLDEVTLNLYDSFGDGGGSITIDGVTYTLLSGSSQAFPMICVDLSICNDAIYAATDSWPSENSWDIVDASGAVIASGGPNSGTFGNCVISGCMDTNATNYDATATVDDGSCTYSCAYLGLDEVTLNLFDSWGDGWNGNSLTIDGVDYTIAGWASSESFVICVDLSICNTATYNATGSFQSENSWHIVDNATGAVLVTGADNSADFGNCAVLGCTDPAACNYDASANTDDGSCILPDGCTDPAACNYDASAMCDDGSCLTAYGCMDSTA
ncbi:MAG: hypothetical protein VYB55_04415, partial [Bacteroidota bacterium]|nr:hypothetical protein [Bacteroidota bacterium]